jgi:GNAT superfamily N-acetyltransferase
MITILETTKEEVKPFNDSVWRSVDMEHYGKVTDWVTREYAFKALDGDEVVGTIIGAFEAGVLHINSMLVREDQRGKGIGKMLMEKAENFGKDLGAHKAHLNTGRDWEARKFYEALGYKMVTVLPNHHFGKDFVIYEKFF